MRVNIQREKKNGRYKEGGNEAGQVQRRKYLKIYEAKRGREYI